ncbi:hypothetical protein TSH58p_31245 (plasmid) [Azospirillum sp. TSH58]|uniref:poly-beta-hydroxybutyrate polymerase N-terminal domain-containing protein n=1 Tax=Azospirillum sp. TSH58 TaxID=664962 RepID=UPI000D5FEB39|nr:poly-beta-hydroxybutyrate polymerase N-terminal domain-containing protein [Azospirillum sp. TSH58]AWJ87975.1 hypothetical protein TSH58p_31245 [Azospirillum sp. TSH58]
MVTTQSPDRDDLRTAKGGAPPRLAAAPGPQDGAFPSPPARSRATARRSPAYSFPYLPIRGELIDHLVHAWQSRFTLSVSPATLALAFADWTMHGHKTGIIAGPDNPKIHFRLTEREADARYTDPDTWIATAPLRSGSWWPAWTDWLMRRSSSKHPPPPTFGEPERGYPPLGPAPGRYVLEP